MSCNTFGLNKGVVQYFLIATRVWRNTFGLKQGCGAMLNTFGLNKGVVHYFWA